MEGNVYNFEAQLARFSATIQEGIEARRIEVDFENGWGVRIFQWSSLFGKSKELMEIVVLKNGKACFYRPASELSGKFYSEEDAMRVLDRIRRIVPSQEEESNVRSGRSRLSRMAADLSMERELQWDEDFEHLLHTEPAVRAYREARELAGRDSSRNQTDKRGNNNG